MIALLLAAPALLPATPQEDAAAAPQRPAYQFLRWKEDWSVLAAGPLADHEPLDALKHVPLSEDGDVWASFGGSARLRVEAWDDFNFGAPAGADHHDVYASGRALLHADVRAGDDLRLFVEGKSALVTDRDLPGGKRTIDEDKLDLQQLFLDVPLGGSGSDVTLRPGRQELLFGRQRLVSPLPWGNTLRTWDGASVHAAFGDWDATAFYTEFVPVDPDRFNDSNDDERFHGVYATGAGLPGGVGLDLYWLYLDRDPASFNGTSGAEERHTLGARASARHERLDWDLEVALQRGDVGAGDVEAEMLAAQVGLTLGGPRVWIGLDYASGDDEAGGDVETFNQLYPLGHAYFGQADAIGRQNVVDASAGLDLPPFAGWRVGLEGHLFRAADTDDAIYNAGGGVVRPGGSYTSKDVALEADLTASRRVSRHLVLSFGYSRVFAGDALEESGPAEDVDFAFAAAEYTF